MGEQYAAIIRHDPPFAPPNGVRLWPCRSPGRRM
jgi:hypothetical protein